MKLVIHYNYTLNYYHEGMQLTCHQIVIRLVYYVFLVLRPSQYHIICPESIGSFVFLQQLCFVIEWLCRRKARLCHSSLAKMNVLWWPGLQPVRWRTRSSWFAWSHLRCLPTWCSTTGISPPWQKLGCLLFFGVLWHTAYSKNFWVIHVIPVEWWVKDPTWQTRF